MLPGTLGVIIVIVSIILVASGWGSHVIQTANLKRTYLLLAMVLYVILCPISLGAIFFQSITVTGAIFPCFLFVICFAIHKGWKKKLLFPIKAVTVGSAIAGVSIWLNQIFGWQTDELCWIATGLIACTSFCVCRSFLDRWGTAIFAVETASIWIDVCIRYVPMEHLVIGSPITQDLNAAVSLGVWTISTLIHEVNQIWMNRNISILHSRMKRT